ncbi:hypothetical protein IEN85_14635 [Pelagicoccus sp. NFK12]|uniref:Uncharacterized protein n=1 Tax=Pelagicoccus enzymogenes TaxID=2773457 RepID=A0A927IID4_9BACT|nr:hypothetical protein [Pelagicoccus enzymogenes]MBD5780734.1 hypothetical protein [Pelagicoccus enzymogenes]MDQ8200102.1 hypothetical protein [Pelagicoccus enzymogenes]
MRNSSTLKSVLNRQIVTLSLGSSFGAGSFDCRQEASIGTDSPTISFKPFERVYKIPSRDRGLALEAS